jgi:hypothetical protein
LPEALARVRGVSVTSRPTKLSAASRRLALRLVSKAFALPARIYVGAVLCALLAGIGVNALMFQRERHPAPFFAAATPQASSVSSIAHPQPMAPLNPPHAAPNPVSGPAPTARLGAGEMGSRGTDQIGELLREDPQSENASLVLAAQNALIKLGYVVKADGNEGAETHQALREFERAHGLPLTNEITSRLVKQLAAAARGAGR